MPRYINGVDARILDAVGGETILGTATIPATSISALSTTTFTTTVSGAKVGAAVGLYPRADVNWSTSSGPGGPWYAYVSAVNTVTIKIRNAHASAAWSLPAGTWEVRVFKK